MISSKGDRKNPETLRGHLFKGKFVFTKPWCLLDLPGMLDKLYRPPPHAHIPVFMSAISLFLGGVHKTQLDFTPCPSTQSPHSPPRFKRRLNVIRRGTKERMEASGARSAMQSLWLLYGFRVGLQLQWAKMALDFVKMGQSWKATCFRMSPSIYRLKQWVDIENDSFVVALTFD